jgi:glutaminyl-peptide cyclotransferase
MSFLNIFSIILISFLCYDVHLVQTRRVKHNVKAINAKQYQCFSTIPNNFDDFRENLLRPLLIPRVSGTTGNAQARQHILSKLRSTNMWNIELDTFDAMTPDGQVEFTNIVATLDPTATRRLVLACHYDSKKLPNFIGATDSAVPCAILLDVVINLQQKLNELKQNRGNPTLQLIFFDGEEAVRQWTSTDSIYGARHLATKMRNTNVQGQQNLNQIDAIDMFVLLDLIGHKNVQFTNFYDQTTGRYYNRLRDIETGLLRSYNNPNAQKRSIFSSNMYGGQIEDDHIPFLNYSKL